jgi:hypothetical protein
MADKREDGRWWQTRGGIVLLGSLAIVGFFLVTQHTAHVFGVLPYLLLLACPLMHAFMHRGRHRGASRDGGPHRHERPPCGRDGTGGAEP